MAHEFSEQRVLQYFPLQEKQMRMLVRNILKDPNCPVISSYFNYELVLWFLSHASAHLWLSRREKRMTFSSLGGFWQGYHSRS